MLFSGVASAVPAIDSSFDSSMYQGISEQQYNSYCQETYSGMHVSKKIGLHAYDRRCRMEFWGAVYDSPIDTNQLCMTLYSPNHRAVLLGGGVNDWACTDWSDVDYKVVPVVAVATEHFYDVDAISSAVQTAARVTLNTRNWYREAMDSDATYIAARPVVHLSLQGSDYWHNLSCLTSAPDGADPFPRPDRCVDRTSPADRNGYFYGVRDEVEYLFESKDSGVHTSIVSFVYTGENDADIDRGAAALHGHVTSYSVQAPAILSCDETDIWCGIYAVGHELGHTFDLGHTADLDPRPDNYHHSIMQSGGNQSTDMFLATTEQNLLDESNYFSIQLEPIYGSFSNPRHDNLMIGYPQSGNYKDATLDQFCIEQGYANSSAVDDVIFRAGSYIGALPYYSYVNGNWTMLSSETFHYVNELTCVRY